jgi:hypothetical protein
MKDLKANLIKNGSQTIVYKGLNLTVYWGGEYYTAHYDGEVYRQTCLCDLKKDISNGWCVDFGGDMESKLDDIATCLCYEAKNLEGEKVEFNAADDSLTIVCSSSDTKLRNGTHKTRRWAVRDCSNVGSSFLSIREAVRFILSFASYESVL